jgi:hypothetical protein
MHVRDGAPGYTLQKRQLNTHSSEHSGTSSDQGTFDNIQYLIVSKGEIKFFPESLKMRRV